MFQHYLAGIWAVVGAVAIASAQPAMSLSTEGRGSVLHYPYYTVNGGFDSLVSVVNTKSKTKAVRVRFLEYKNARSVFEFNLFLSPFDVWTGVVTRNAATGGAVLRTRDLSCTAPSIKSAGQSFTTSNLRERDADGIIIDESLARTSQGFIELIEMGEATNVDVVYGTTHANGVPLGCSRALNALYDSTLTTLTPAAATAFSAPTGGLTGTVSLINVAQGVDFSLDAVALDNVFLTPQHNVPTSTKPTIIDAQRKAVWIHEGDIYSAEFDSGQDAVSALYMRASVTNEWTIDPAIGARTDLVFTFPTKAPYSYECGVVADRPFMNSGFCETGAQERSPLNSYDREERTDVGRIQFGFAFPPDPWEFLTLRHAASAVRVAKGSILGSLDVEQLALPPLAFFSSGYSRISFNNSVNRVVISRPGALRNGTPCGAVALAGLPVIGFTAQRYVNGNVEGVLSNYGGSFVHKGERSVQCSPAQ